VWDEQLLARQGHLLQSWAWGELKGRFGWRPHRLQTEAGLAQILFRRLPLGLTIAYIPKGPVVDWTDSHQCQALWVDIHAVARKNRAIFLKIEPDVCESDSAAQQVFSSLTEQGFRPADTIQPPMSQILDIALADEAILGAMKQKTRYNIRLAERKGVTVRQGTLADIDHFYELSRLTAERDGFGIHSLAYYQQAYHLFAPDRCTLLLAEYEQTPLAALMVFKQGTTAYYLYGASSNEERNRMPTYVVQWAAIAWAKAQGCRRYDLWGIPDADPDTLEAEFQSRNDGLWGVYRFIRGFGGELIRSIGAFDYVYQSAVYPLYKWWRRG
jgi:lipid II:glycine glycyltransferase (peptidoglycan interpeptide bridge formation enzyme)